VGLRFLFWVRDRNLDTTGSKFSGALVDREHAKFREYRGSSGRTVVAIGDDEGLPITAGVEQLLNEVLIEIRAIRLGMEVLTEEQLKEDVA